MSTGSSEAGRDLESLSISGLGRVNELCDAFEAAWRSGQRPRIEAFLPDQPAELRTTLLREFLLMELELREAAGDPAALEEYLARFPEHAGLVRTVFEPSAREGSTLARSTQPMPSADQLAAHAAAGRSTMDARDATRSLDGDHAPADAGAPQVVDGLRPGDRVGPYRLDAYIDGGGMGRVWRAWAETNDQVVALKLIRPGHGRHGTRIDGTHRIALFLREMKAATRLNGHPGIVPVYFAGCDAGRYFYAMPYVEWHSLHRLLRDRGPMPPRAAASLLREVALAIHHAHTLGVVHRDLKPRNILVDRHGRAHVLDFGLAQFIAAAAEANAEASGGDEPDVAVGTLPYMAPEVLLRSGSDAAAADIFSLGVTLYEALTGRRPFHAADDRAIVRRILQDDPEPPSRVQPGIPPELDAICRRCLDKRPSARYPDAAALARQLGRYLDRRPVEGVRYSPWRRAWLVARRSPAITAAVLIAALALGGLLAFLAANWRAESAAAARLVDRLAHARFADLEPLLAEIDAHRAAAEPHLANLDRVAAFSQSADLQARADLGLLPTHPDRAARLAARLAATPDADEHRVIRDALRPLARAAAAVLGPIAARPGDDEPVARPRVNAAAALLAWNADNLLDDLAAEPARALLGNLSDPTEFNRLATRLEETGPRPGALAERLAREPSAAVRAGLILGLGPTPPADPGVEALLWRRYDDDPDGLVHAALFCRLNAWGRADRLAEADARLARRDAPGLGAVGGARTWFVNSQGQTFLVLAGRPDAPLPPGVRPFALAMTELPLGAYVRLRPPPAHDHPGLPCDRPDPADPRAARRPVSCVSAVDAMAYCRRLSEADGVAPDQMCYPALDAINADTVPRPNFAARAGWRLPTVEEWDYACRAGTVTEHSFGRDPDAMTRHAWTRSRTPDHAMPVGLLRPNPWGFLDMLGNVAEWCSDPTPPTCRYDPLAPLPEAPVVVKVQQPTRGGSFYSARPEQLRFEAFRGIAPYSDAALAWNGFRIARTLDDRAGPPDPPPTPTRPR